MGRLKKQDRRTRSDNVCVEGSVGGRGAAKPGKRWRDYARLRIGKKFRKSRGTDKGERERWSKGESKFANWSKKREKLARKIVGKKNIKIHHKGNKTHHTRERTGPSAHSREEANIKSLLKCWTRGEYITGLPWRAG